MPSRYWDKYLLFCHISETLSKSRSTSNGSRGFQLTLIMNPISGLVPYMSVHCWLFSWIMRVSLNALCPLCKIFYLSSSLPLFFLTFSLFLFCFSSFFFFIPIIKQLSFNTNFGDQLCHILMSLLLPRDWLMRLRWSPDGIRGNGI